MLTANEIKAIVSDYFKDNPVKKVSLFGSYVRVEADEHSDVDLLLELDYSNKIGINFIRWNITFEEHLKKKIDLVPEDVMYDSVRRGLTWIEF